MPGEERPFTTERMLVLFSVLLMLATYAVDITAPLGVPVWLFYSVPLAITLSSSRYSAIPTVCAVTLLFLITGLFFSPQGMPFTLAMEYRLAFSAIIVLLSAMVWQLRRQQVRRGVLSLS